MKNHLLCLSFLLSLSGHSQNPCYVQPVSGFSTNAMVIKSADFTGDGIKDLAIAGVSLSIYPGLGNGTFSNPSNYVHGGSTFQQSDMAVADFNADGKPDLAISTYTNKVCVLIKTAGGFASPQVYFIVGGSFAICTGDFNNDGKTDIATANNLTNGMSILLNNGLGAFNAPVNYTFAGDPTSICSADFNNDNKMDLAITNNAGNTVYMYVNNGTGQFTPTTSIVTPTTCTDIQSVDFDNDGNKDIAVTMTNGYLNVFNGNGSAGFTVSATYGVGFNANNLEVADMNGDNIPDIVATDNLDVVNSYLNNGSGVFTRTSWISAFSGKFTINDFTGDGRPDFAGSVSGYGIVLVNNGQGGFFTTKALKVLDIGAGNGITHVSTGDMNGDGHLDIVSADFNLGSFSILHGNGAGLFSTTSYSTNFVPLATNAGDFNGDGKLDLAVVGFTNNLSIYMNGGLNTFTLNATYAAGVSPHRVLAKDMNNDGHLDLVVANYGSNSISIRLGTGTGSFGNASTYPVGSNANDITIADFNNDGNKDVAVAVWNNMVTVFNGSPSGSLTSSTNYIVSSVPGGITSGDFNNDGSIDLAISCAFSNNLAVKLNNGGGSFGASTFYTIGWDNRTILAGDYNGDGNLDLATGADQGGTLKLFTGNGVGGFAQGVPFVFGSSARVIASGDFNSDGKPDFAGASTHYIPVMVTSNVPTITVSGPSITCANASLTLTASGASGYYWSGLPVGSGSLASYSPTSNVVYTITGINSPACPVISIKSVSVIPSPSVLIAASAASICNGGSVTLIASGAVSYTWNTGTINSSVTLSPSTTISYTVTGTGNNACNDTAVKWVTVYPLPTLTVSGPTLLCTGNSASLVVSGATSYSWSTAANTSVIVVSPSVNTCYTVTGVSMGCTNIATPCLSVNATPTLLINPSTASVCLGTSQTFTASGAGTYTWLPNINTPTHNVLPLSNSTYTLFGETNGCIGSGVVSVSVNPLCSDVWPGDTNSDGIVDASDVLEIGLAFMNSGPTRPIQGNSYSPHYSGNWTGTVSSGKNKCHANCNGDGLINHSDTLAISTNFSLSHTFKPTHSTSSPDIYLVSTNANQISAGVWNKLDIYLSNVSTPISVYGTAFDIGFDASLLETDAASLYYSPSFINTNNVNVEFRKLLFSSGVICGATVRTDAINANGGGKIGEFYFMPKAGLLDGTLLNVTIGNSTKVNADYTSAPLAGDTLQLIVNTAVGINEGVLDRFHFYPNPAMNSITMVVPTQSPVVYEIFDLWGRKLVWGTLSEQKITDISSLSSGTYTLIVKSGESVTYRKLIVLK